MHVLTHSLSDSHRLMAHRLICCIIKTALSLIYLVQVARNYTCEQSGKVHDLKYRADADHHSGLSVRLRPSNDGTGTVRRRTMFSRLMSSVHSLKGSTGSSWASLSSLTLSEREPFLSRRPVCDDVPSPFCNAGGDIRRGPGDGVLSRR